MSTSWDFGSDIIIPLFETAKTSSYTYVAGITIVIHDALVLFPKEKEHIYSGRWNLIRVLYILIRLLALVDFIDDKDFPTRAGEFNVYSDLRHPLTSTWQTCQAITWVTGFARHIAYTCIIKTLLVMRLRALYGSNNLKVTVLLVIALAVELASAAFNYFFVSISMQINGIFWSPAPGCSPAILEHLLPVWNWSSTILWGSKLFSNTVEVSLTLGKLYGSLKAVDNNLMQGLERMKNWRPVFYVFYRDGTLFFIPMFLVSILGLLESRKVIQTTTSWTMWLSLIYCTCGARLILNLRMANCRLSQSTIPNQISTLQFHLSTYSSGSGTVVTK